MSIQEVRDFIQSIASMLYFKYKGKDGHIDPYARNRILLWYNGKEQVVTSVDDAMNTPFIDGKSITQAFQDITNIEY